VALSCGEVTGHYTKHTNPTLGWGRHRRSSYAAGRRVIHRGQGLR
jgi:hypothetical protein